MEDKKRYSSEPEINLLLDLVAQEQGVIKDRRTDHAMIKKKKEAWEKITGLYNAAAAGPPRSTQQLKRMWEHQKIKAKKKNAEEKRERMKTGGGPPPKIDESSTHAKVLGLIDDELEPGSNEFDCDVVPMTNNPVQADDIEDTGDTCTNEVSDVTPEDRVPSTSTGSRSGPQTPSTHWETPRTHSASPPPAKRSACAETSTRRLRSRKFSVTDECMNENMRLRRKEHDIDMEMKEIEKENMKLHNQALQLKIEKEIEAAIASTRAANAITRAANAVFEYIEKLSGGSVSK